MTRSQSSAEAVTSLYSGTETGIKRIVPHRGSASGFDPPRSSPEAEPRLLMKNPTERKYGSAQETVRVEVLWVFSERAAFGYTLIDARQRLDAGIGLAGLQGIPA